ncbi:TonB-dependent receptor plug domain-containing protein [Sphingomonas sp. BT553]|uniref:TonB-dependent receptor plug domain-containing protein n=1 Tax=Sphingomonas mollis TaxID=2795726 RepID=A0ABS0XUF8_9SPHN|nr:TonB-dependent receptor plug domain-containing protein [Sphingomonas sp. BT553]
MSSVYRVCLRGGLLIGTSLACILPAEGQVPPAPAQGVAKTVGQDAGETDGADIVVTGFRASQRSATKAKRESAVILDAVSQDDVGRLPDLNIVEASRRITGVSVVGGADATKNRDIYQRATIRGLDPRYNLVTIDGIPLASPDWVFRGARLDMLPSSLVSRIEAIKSVTAQYDPHALGGQINIVSKSAFDGRSGRFFVVNANGGYNDTAGKLIRDGGPSIRADATAATRFGADRDFGVVASVEYQRLPSTARAELPGDSSGAGWFYFTASGARTPFPNLSTGSLVPVRNQDYFFENMRTRLSGNLKLEWRPDDATELSLFGGYYHDKDTETRYEILTLPTGAPTAVTTTSGAFAQGDLQQGLTYQPVTRDTWLIDARGRHDFGNGVVLDTTLARSKAEYRELREMIKYDTSPRPGTAQAGFLPAFGYGYTIADGRPRLTLTTPLRPAIPTAIARSTIAASTAISIPPSISPGSTWASTQPRTTAVSAPMSARR